MFVYDLECNCSQERNGIKFNECIELPVVVLNLKTNQFEAEFHTYIRPTVEHKITQFCTELTGITNDMAFTNKDGGLNPTFEEALDMLHQFIVDKGFIDKNFVLLSCGDFDGNHIARESAYKKLKTKQYMRRWINIKKVFPPDELLKKP